MSVVGRALARRQQQLEQRAGSGVTLASFFGGLVEGGGTDAGVDVSITGALGLPAVGRAIRGISRDVGTMPLLTYTGDPERPTAAPGAPQARLLRRRPNPEMVASVAWTCLVRHLAGWGQAFLGKTFVGGRVVELWPIVPERVTVELRRGTKTFHVVTDTAGVKQYTERDVVHVLLDSHDGYQGLSPIAQHRQALGHHIALQRYGSKSIGNRAIPSGVLRVKKPLSDPAIKKRMKAEWKSLHGGSGRAHEIAILDEDAEFQPLSLPLVDAQFIQQLGHGIVEVAQIFNVPAHKLQGSTGDSLTYSTREANQLEYLTDALRPYMVAVEDAFNADDDLFGDGHFCRFNADALLRVDPKTRAEINAIALGRHAYKTPSEVRAEEQGLPVDERFDVVPKTPAPAAGGGAKEPTS